MIALRLRRQRPLNTIYTEENNMSAYDENTNKKVKKTAKLWKGAHERQYRTVMIEGYRHSSIGTGLGLGNLCI